MGEDAQDQLTLLGGCPARGQRGAKSALVAAEGALGMPALVVERLWEALAHLAPVGGAWPAPSHIARVQLDHGPAHAEFLSAEPVVVLGVVARVRQRGLDREQRRRFPHRGRKVGRILRGTGPGHRAQDEVRVRIDDRREFRPRTSASVLALRLAAANAVVEADVAGLQTRGIHSGDRRGSDQASLCVARARTAC